MRHSASPTGVSERPFLSSLSTNESTLDIFESFDSMSSSSNVIFRSLSSGGVRYLDHSWHLLCSSIITAGDTASNLCPSNVAIGNEFILAVFVCGGGSLEK